MSDYRRTKISPLVSEKLPEFIRQEHPNFVVFLEEYYKWLESQDNEYFVPLKLEGLVNIDTTVDDFLDYFKTLLFDGFPENYKSSKGDQVDITLILKKIRSFYQSKGTESSIKFLMTLLFDVYSEIYVPSEDIFKASGGIWNQPTIIRCLDTDPSISRTLRNLKIDFYDSSDLKIGSGRIKDIKQFSKLGYPILELDITEFTGSSSYPGTVRVNRKDGSSLTFRMISFVTSVSVSSPGSYYSLDDEVIITTASGYNGIGFKGSVETLTPNGGIRSVRLDDPGLFYYPLSSSYVHYTISVTSETGTGASGFEITTGTKVKKPGFYENNDGHLSSTEKLQDNYRYQIHSYVVRTEANLSEYEKTLRKLTHPAGKLVLGDYFVYRTESLTASTGGYGTIVLSEPYFANYFPYTIAEVSDGATTEVGSFGVLPSDYDLRGVSSDSLLGSLTDPPIYADYFPFGYDGSTGYTIVSTDEFRSASGDGISSGWENQNFNIFGGVDATQEFFSREMTEDNIIRFYDSGNSFFDPSSTAFSVGQKIHQGDYVGDGSTQARGTVVSWNSGIGRLTVRVTNGSFTAATAGSVLTGNTANCIMYGETSGTAYTGGGIYESLVTFRTGGLTHAENAFTINERVKQNNIDAIVLGWTGGTYGQLLIGTTGQSFDATPTGSDPIRVLTTDYTNKVYKYDGGVTYTGGGNDYTLLTFSNTDDVHPFTAFSVGQKIHQGDYVGDGSTQARGTVVSWTFNNALLGIRVDNGTFRIGTKGEVPTSITTGCIFYGETTGTAYTGGGSADGNSGGFVTSVSTSPNWFNGGIVLTNEGPTGYSGGFVTSQSPTLTISYVGVTLPGWLSDNTAFWIVHPHPNTWHGNVPFGSTWGGIVLQDFIRSSYNITSPPVKGSSYGSQGTLGQSPSIPFGYGEGI